MRSASTGNYRVRFALVSAEHRVCPSAARATVSEHPDRVRELAEPAFVRKLSSVQVIRDNQYMPQSERGLIERRYVWLVFNEGWVNGTRTSS